MKGCVAIVPVNSVYHVDPGSVINFKFCLLLVSVLACHDACVEIRGGVLVAGSSFHCGFFKCFYSLSPLTRPDTISKNFFFFFWQLGI